MESHKPGQSGTVGVERCEILEKYTKSGTYCSEEHCCSPKFYSCQGEKASQTTFLAVTGRIFPKKPTAVTVNHNHAGLYGICITLE